VSDEIVRLEILDASGRCVRRLWHGTPGAGPRQVIWDTTDDGGRSVASGVYWAILRRGDAAERRALQVLR
jgi:flagellar hook assembly protein FlgD